MAQCNLFSTCIYVYTVEKSSGKRKFDERKEYNIQNYTLIALLKILARKPIEKKTLVKEKGVQLMHKFPLYSISSA